MSEKKVIREIRDELVLVIDTEAKLKLLAQDCEIPVGKIPMEGSLEVKINSILTYSWKQDPSLLQRFVDRVVEDHPSLNRLREIVHKRFSKKSEGKSPVDSSAKKVRGRRLVDGALIQGNSTSKSIARYEPVNVAVKRSETDLLLSLINDFNSGKDGEGSPKEVRQLDQRTFVRAKSQNQFLIVKLERGAKCSYSKGLANYFEQEFPEGVVQGYLDRHQIKYVHWFNKHFGLSLKNMSELMSLPSAYFLFCRGQLIGYHTALPKVTEEQLQIAGLTAVMALAVGFLVESKDPFSAAVAFGSIFLSLNEGEQELVKVFDPLIMDNQYTSYD